MESYPASSRKTYFAFRFTRLMAKTCVAQEVGPLGCWLLTTIAMTEDASRYRRAVTWYDHQLTPLLGCSQDAMARARKKCVDAGWLHYEHGSKGKPGKYWVIVPQHADGIPDTPTDESDIRPQIADESATISGGIRDERTTNPRQSAVAFATFSGQIPAPIIPIPSIPEPIPANANNSHRGYSAVSDDVTCPPETGIGPTAFDGGLVIEAWNAVANRLCGPGGYAPYSTITLSPIDQQKLKDIWHAEFLEDLKSALKATPDRGTGKQTAITLGAFLAFSDTRDIVMSFKPRKRSSKPASQPPLTKDQIESKRIAEVHAKALGSPEAKANAARYLAKQKELEDAAIANAAG